jgi:hypothetical protein
LVKHRWAGLLTQQTSITVYRLPTKQNKLPFSLSICSKQMEVLPFQFSVCGKQTEVVVFR